MATTTPNFGWPVPTSTDLVKDGATAMEALGDAIDTSMVDLKGGTTGQVLAKASNTDMDFSWVAQDDSNAIQNTIVDAKGDLIAATAADTPARLAVGNNGETLVADSSTLTGLRYTAGNVNQNPVINSAMQVWQRGTSFSVAASTQAYTADRWQVATQANQASTISRQTVSDTTNLPNIQYALRVQRNSGQTGTGGLGLGQSIETVNSIPYAGKTITLSFYARAGANYSPTGNGFFASVYTGTGTDQNVLVFFTGSTQAFSTSPTLTTTWTRYTATGTISSTATQLGLYMSMTPTGTAGANDWYEITGIQLDVGSVALPFRTFSATIQGELAACQRYYIRQGGDTAFQTLASGYGASTTTAVTTMVLPVKMRVAPTSVDFSTIRVHNTSAGYAITAVAIDTNFNSSFQPVATSTIGSASLTIANGYIIGANNSTSAYLGFSAEL